MSEIFVYLVDLPDGFQEVVMPCAEDNYTVYIDARLDYAQRQKAYRHALRHIQNDDFSKPNVQEIEYEAHRKDEKE